MAIDPAVLDRFSALIPLGADARRAMAPVLQATSYRSGAQICREGDDGESCYLLSRGSVSVTKALPDGRRVRLATLPEGTLFGQAGLVPGQRRTADVRAEGDVEILALTQRTLGWALGRGDAWAVAMQAIVAVDLVRQLRGALERLADLAAKEDVTEEITGRKRSEVAVPQSVSADFSGAERKARDKKQEEAATTGGSMGGLLELLRSTEASLASAGIGLDNIEFVYDEDMMRTAEARTKH